MSEAKPTKPLTLAAVEEAAVLLARALMEWDEPIPDISGRFPGRLESCLDTPFQSGGGEDLYPDLIKKASMLFYLLIKNHPFQNGNKRIAVTSLLVFLIENGKYLQVDPILLYRFAKEVAESDSGRKDVVVSDIEQYLRDHLIDLPEII